MPPFSKLISKLRTTNPSVRYEACEELRVEPWLPDEAIAALREVASDADALVADAAQRALSVHAAYPRRAQVATAVRPTDAEPPAVPNAMRRMRQLSGAIAATTSAVGVCAGAMWIAALPGMPPGTGEPLGYLAGLYICIVSPLLAALAALITNPVQLVADRLRLPIPPNLIAIILGLAIGMGMSLVPTLLLANYCDPALSRC